MFSDFPTNQHPWRYNSNNAFTSCCHPQPLTTWLCDFLFSSSTFCPLYWSSIAKYGNRFNISYLVHAVPHVCMRAAASSRCYFRGRRPLSHVWRCVSRGTAERQLFCVCEHRRGNSVVVAAAAAPSLPWIIGRYFIEQCVYLPQLPQHSNFWCR